MSLSVCFNTPSFISEGIRGEPNVFKRILVALDGSEHANNALNVALDLAEKYSATILILSVFRPEYAFVGIQPTFTSPNTLQAFEAQKLYLENVLSGALQKAKESKPDVDISTKIVEGGPAETIIGTAQEENVDLIVMGSRGLGGIRQLLLGSVSNDVADKAPCPVLIVR